MLGIFLWHQLFYFIIDFLLKCVQSSFVFFLLCKRNVTSRLVSCRCMRRNEIFLITLNQLNHTVQGPLCCVSYWNVAFPQCHKYTLFSLLSFSSHHHLTQFFWFQLFQLFSCSEKFSVFSFSLLCKPSISILLLKPSNFLFKSSIFCWIISLSFLASSSSSSIKLDEHLLRIAFHLILKTLFSVISFLYS